jgi:hypothetical protein
MSTVTSPSLGTQLAPAAVGTPLTAGASSAADTCSSLANRFFYAVQVYFLFFLFVRFPMEYPK